MKMGLKEEAFTIIEVMIVLAVTSALLVSGLLLVSGQQQRTEFRTAMDEIKQQIDEVITNVATGYYATVGNVNCTPSPTGPNITAGGAGDDRGRNTGCIYIGRAMQFGESGTNGRGYNVYSLVGLQNSLLTGDDVTNLNEALPHPIHTTVERRELNNALAIERMRYDDTNNTGVVAFVTDFAQRVNGSLSSSSRTAQLFALDSVTSALDKDIGATLSDLECGGTGAGCYERVDNVTLCFRSGGTDQFGIITIGGNNRQLTTIMRIADIASAPTECV